MFWGCAGFACLATQGPAKQLGEAFGEVVVVTPPLPWQQETGEWRDHGAWSRIQWPVELSSSHSEQSDLSEAWSDDDEGSTVLPDGDLLTNLPSEASIDDSAGISSDFEAASCAPWDDAEAKESLFIAAWPALRDLVRDVVVGAAIVAL